MDTRFGNFGGAGVSGFWALRFLDLPRSSFDNFFLVVLFFLVFPVVLFSCRICVFLAAVWRVFAGVLAGFCGRFAAHGTLRKIAAVCGKKCYENQNNQKTIPVRSSR